ncbi:MAG TPA: GNAT family N-acetyltransferase [Thermodesulfovibrionia bacterium]|nr:GNAT family N-acetyltransferase [Thermodesulfovibrionia bacterium]
MEMLIRQAGFNDISVLSELYQKQFEYQLSLNPYYELVDNFDWKVFTNGKLNRTNAVVYAAVFGSTIAGFIDIRIVHFNSQKKGRFLSFLPKLSRTKKQPGLPLKPMKCGLIENCYIAPEFRRHGVGSRLVDEARKWFSKNDIHRIEISVAAQNPEALDFWKRCGFEPFRVLCFTITGK